MTWAGGLFATWGLATAMAAIACSSSSSNPPGGSKEGPPTALDEAKNVKDLTAEEAFTYCRGLGEYFVTALSIEEHHKWTCNYDGLRAAVASKTSAEAKPRCIERRDACLQSTPPDAGTPDPGAGDAGTDDPCADWKPAHDGCTGNLTVGDLNGCWKATTKGDKEFAARDVCADMGPDAVAELDKAGDEPPECLVLAEKCPAVYE